MWIEAARSHCNFVLDPGGIALLRYTYSSLAYRMSNVPVRFAIVLLVQQLGAQSVAAIV